jgi:hypothetical protein
MIDNVQTASARLLLAIFQDRTVRHKADDIRRIAEEEIGGLTPLPAL